MNAFETDFQVGTRVKAYNPYGSFTYDVVVKSISPKGSCFNNPPLRNHN